MTSITLPIMLLAGMLFAWGALYAPTATCQSLAPATANPSSSITDKQDMQQLHLLLVINGLSTNRIIPVQKAAKVLRLRASDVEEFDLSTYAKDGTWVDVNAIPQLQVNYLVRQQQLELTAPPDWLSHKRFDYQQDNFVRAVSSTGATLNYNLYSYHTQQRGWHHSLWHEARVFNPAGVWRTSGLLRHQNNRARWNQARRYLRYDTSWQTVNQAKMRTIELGDFITRTPTWASAVRLGGMQLSKNFDARPDLITYPLPAFSGQVDVPTTVDLFINGVQAQRHDMAPGPFTITDQPNITGAGEATLVYRDAQGRLITDTLPFYASNRLLKPGLNSYSIALGAMRQNFGQRSFDYGQAASSFSYRHGINAWLTLGGHAEFAQSFSLGALSSTVKLGRLGILETAWQHSRYRSHRSHAHTLNFQHQRKRFNVSAQLTRQRQGFRTLANLNSSSQWNVAPAQHSYHITAGASLGRWGNIGAGYFYNRLNANRLATHVGGPQTTRVWNVSYHKPIGPRTFLHAGVNRHLNRGWTGMLQLSITLPGNHGSLTMSGRRTQEGQHQQVLQAQRSAPLSGGWGWNFGVQRQAAHAHDYHASITQRNRFATLRTGTSREQGHQQYFGELSGAIAVMDKQTFLANEINDSFAVVSTAGIPDVPVFYENQAMGRTNRKGYLLVPYGTAYYLGKYRIDPLSLPANIHIPQTEQRVAIKSHSGYLLPFHLQAQQPAHFTLVDDARNPLAAGTRITTSSGLQTYVGYEGLLYLENLDEATLLTAHLTDNQRCQAWLRPADNLSSGQAPPPTITCRHDELPTQ